MVNVCRFQRRLPKAPQISLIHLLFKMHFVLFSFELFSRLFSFFQRLELVLWNVDFHQLYAKKVIVVALQKIIAVKYSKLIFMILVVPAASKYLLSKVAGVKTVQVTAKFPVAEGNRVLATKVPPLRNKSNTTLRSPQTGPLLYFFMKLQTSLCTIILQLFLSIYNQVHLVQNLSKRFDYCSIVIISQK